MITSVICDRMKCDLSELGVLDPTNPSFQAGRTTARSVFPMRTAAEYCKLPGVELPALLNDLKWCFDTPASTVVELALKRLGILAFYANLLNGISVHGVRSTITAAGATGDIAQLVHRQFSALLEAVHQLGHPENRKRPHEYAYHERYNAKVDTLTHELTLGMPLYVSFKRMGRAQTRVWYEPHEQENVGRGTCHEVTSGVFKNIARSAQRRASIARSQSYDGEHRKVL